MEVSGFIDVPGGNSEGVISREYAIIIINFPLYFMGARAFMDMDDVGMCRSRACKHVANMWDKNLKWLWLQFWLFYFTTVNPWNNCEARWLCNDEK